MDPSSPAFVVSHPAHLLTVAGMVMRWSPSILILTKTDTGAGASQVETIREILEEIGLTDRGTFLGFDEEESYAAALAGDATGQIHWCDGIYEWLAEIRPDVVFGDAFEAYNFQHDIGRLMLDEAIYRMSCEGHVIANYEFPLACQGEASDAELIMGEFVDGSGEMLRLTESEIESKQKIVDDVRKRDSFVDQVALKFPSVAEERYRSVPDDRDYTRPPAGLRRFYDEWGRKQVEAGKYEKVITFEEHFVPIVEALQARRETLIQ